MDQAMFVKLLLVDFKDNAMYSRSPCDGGVQFRACIRCVLFMDEAKFL